MDLQLLALEITATPNVYDGVKPVFSKAYGVKDITCEEDLDSLLKMLAGTGLEDILSPIRVNVDLMITQANVSKPYINHKQLEDNFV